MRRIDDGVADAGYAAGGSADVRSADAAAYDYSDDAITSDYGVGRNNTAHRFDHRTAAGTRGSASSTSATSGVAVLSSV
jgi:hypothetical protein